MKAPGKPRGPRHVLNIKALLTLFFEGLLRPYEGSFKGVLRV
jgi:hypothetical protein